MSAWRELSFPLKGDDAAVYIDSGERSYAAVADGVGSFSGGGDAARAVIDLVRFLALEGRSIDVAKLFRECKSLLSNNKQDLKLGTTLTFVELCGGVVRYGHVGDCRLYQLRGNGIRTITEDQTELNYLLEKGVINKYEAKSYRRANVLMSWLAPDKDFDLQEGQFEVSKGDRLILCSDGFYKCLSKELLRDISVNSPNYNFFVQSVSDKLMSMKRSDDATALILEVS